MYARCDDPLTMVPCSWTPISPLFNSRPRPVVVFLVHHLSRFVSSCDRCVRTSCVEDLMPVMRNGGGVKMYYYIYPTCMNGLK
jgi:hypothetical protein